MARPKKFGDVRRLLLRHLYAEDVHKIAALRDLLWDVVITRKFATGFSMEETATHQPNRSTTREVEHAVRREMRRRAPRD